MKCPKCGYHSFEHLTNCKKCNQDLSDHKAKFNLRGFYASGQVAAAAPAPVIDDSSDAPEPADDGSVDFGFDFLDEEEDQLATADSVALGGDELGMDIDQPFGADSESVPADDDASDDDKPGKGPEFAF